MTITVLDTSGPARQPFGTVNNLDQNSFFGILTDSPLISLDIAPAGILDDGNNFATILDLTVAAAPSPVPEPASLAMLGLTSLGAAGYAWRRRKQPAVQAAA